LLKPGVKKTKTIKGDQWKRKKKVQSMEVWMGPLKDGLTHLIEALKRTEVEVGVTAKRR